MGCPLSLIETGNYFSVKFFTSCVVMRSPVALLMVTLSNVSPSTKLTVAPVSALKREFFTLILLTGISGSPLKNIARFAPRHTVLDI